MPARVQVIIEARDAASGVMRGITAQFGALGRLVEDLTTKNVSWGNIAQSATTMVVDAFKEAMRATTEYAREVRDLSFITGTGAEETSRLIQVMDDYEITAQDLTTATRFMTQQGLAPTVETIAQLSDQYRGLNSTQEKNAFILKNFGRGGLQWVNLLNQGGDALRALNAEIDENLILTEKNLQQAEEYRLAVDALTDTWQGLKIELGTATLPVLADLLIEIQKSIKAIRIWDDILRGDIGIWEAHDQIIKETTTALETAAIAGAEATVTQEALAAALAATDAYYKDLISSIKDAQRETNRYTETGEDLRAELRALDPAAEDYQENFDNLKAKLAENEEAHKHWAAQTIFAFATAKAAAGGMTEEEGKVLIALGVELGIFDQATADTMAEVNKSFDSLDTENAQAVIAKMKDALHLLTDEEWIIRVRIRVEGTLPTPRLPPREQSGGLVYAGAPYMVGEAGPEPFFPSVAGRVLGHAEALHAMTLSGGQTNYFYGPVTLEIAEEGGEGLLALR